jgi:uncharacterized protein YecT (DUF1311 family)
MRQVTVFEMRNFDPKTLARAKETGYGNLFTGARHERPWRPPLMPAQGTRLHARTRIHGVHSALVVGPNGETAPELHCNACGDIRLRFHWQTQDAATGVEGDARADNQTTRWVRVASYQAGPGMGWQTLPRIGQDKPLMKLLESCWIENMNMIENKAILLKTLLFGLIVVVFSIAKTEANEINKYDIRHRCGIYFETEAFFAPSGLSSGTDCDYQSMSSPPSYIFSTRNIAANIVENEEVGFISFSEGNLVYSMQGRYVGAGWNEKIIRREIVNSLKRTKKDKIVVSLIKGTVPFTTNKYQQFICWDGIFFDEKSDGGVVLNLCDEYKKDSPLVSLNSWQAQLIKSLIFYFAFDVLPGFDCAKAASAVEKTICEDDRLSLLDATLASNYKQAQAMDIGAKRQQLLDDQRAWLKQRNACQTIECLADAYTRRIDEVCARYSNSPDTCAK